MECCRQNDANRRRSSPCLEKFRCQIFYTTPEARRLWCLKIFASRTIYVVTCSERRENRICTGINLTYCSIYGGLAVNLPKVKPSWDLSVLDQTRKTTFAWSKINRTKSTNRKMNLIEKLFRKSPRNGGTDKKILWRDRLEYLMKPTTFVHLWLTVASVFCPVSLCDR